MPFTEQRPVHSTLSLTQYKTSSLCRSSRPSAGNSLFPSSSTLKLTSASRAPYWTTYEKWQRMLSTMNSLSVPPSAKCLSSIYLKHITGEIEQMNAQFMRLEHMTTVAHGLLWQDNEGTYKTRRIGLALTKLKVFFARSY